MLQANASPTRMNVAQQGVGLSQHCGCEGLGRYERWQCRFEGPQLAARSLSSPHVCLSSPHVCEWCDGSTAILSLNIDQSRSTAWPCDQFPPAPSQLIDKAPAVAKIADGTVRAVACLHSYTGTMMASKHAHDSSLCIKRRLHL